jgi:hypothetical protein
MNRRHLNTQTLASQSPLARILGMLRAIENQVLRTLPEFAVKMNHLKKQACPTRTSFKPF